MSVKSTEQGKPKIGAGHFQAFARQGLAELRNAMYPDSNVAQRYPEQGLYGTSLQSEVAADRRADVQGHGSMVEERAEKASETVEASRDGRGREPPDIERD